MRDMFY
jgi:hypothetical protein